MIVFWNEDRLLDVLKSPERRLPIRIRVKKLLLAISLAVLVATPAVPAQDQGNWMPDDQTGAGVTGKSRWSFTFSPSATYSSVAGDYYDRAGGGVGFGGAFALAVNDRMAIRLGVNYIGMDWDPDYVFFSVDSSVTVLDQTNNLDGWRFYAAAQYYKHLRPIGDLSMWYVYTGAGVIAHESTSEVTVRETESGQIFVRNPDFSETAFTWTSGAGIVKMFTRRLGLDGGVSFDYVLVESNTNSSASQSGYILEARAGLILML